MEDLYYFRKENDVIKKYDVNFEIGKLAEIKNYIVANCSLIEHYDYESDCEPNRERDFGWQIINYKRESTGKNKDYFEETKTIYHITYDKLIYPYLAQLISRLLDDDISVLDEIYNVNFEAERSVPEYFEAAIEEKEEEIDAIPNKSYAKKRKKLNELEELMTQAKLNENQISVIPFYEEVQDFITLTFVDEISIEEVNKINSFFGKNKIEVEDIRKLNLKNTSE